VKVRISKYFWVKYFRHFKNIKILRAFPVKKSAKGRYFWGGKRGMACGKQNRPSQESSSASGLYP